MSREDRKRGQLAIFVIIHYPGCSEIWMEVDFEHYRVMVRGKGRNVLRFGGGAPLCKCYVKDTRI